MSILQSDIKFYEPAVKGFASTAGGAMSINLLNPSQTGAVIPPLTVAQTQSGGEFYTKFFVSLENSDNTPLYETYVIFTGFDPNLDSYLYILGTETDVQNDASAYTKWKCGGKLSAAANSGGTTISVEFETTDVYLEDVEYLWITDGVNAELVTLDNSSNSSITNNHPDSASITLTIDASYNNGNGLVNSYAVDTPCGLAISVGTLQATLTDLTISSGATVTMNGDISVYNNGTVNESYVLEFTGAQTFKIRDGVDATKYYDQNGNFTDSANAYIFDVSSSAYVYLPNPNRAGANKLGFAQDLFTGATAGDTISFTTHAAAIPVWVKRVVPAGMPSAVETITFELIGQGL